MRRPLYKTYEMRGTVDRNAHLPLSQNLNGTKRIEDVSFFFSDFKNACLLAATYTPQCRLGAIKGEVIDENGKVLRRYTRWREFK
jgi:hypothetical protein